MNFKKIFKNINLNIKTLETLANATHLTQLAWCNPVAATSSGIDPENPADPVDPGFQQHKSRSKDLAGNNFPTSDDLWNGVIVPARKEVIENDLHVGKEIGGALLASHIDPSQDRHVDRQPFGGFRPFHKLLGDELKISCTL